MTIRSYPSGKALSFADSETAPVHLAEIDGRHYYAFADGETCPAGGKAADTDLDLIYRHSQLIRQIKAEAATRILAVAPQWKQQNALADIYLLGRMDTLDAAQTARLQTAEALLQKIDALRQRSDEIEASFLRGVAVEYYMDHAWEIEHA